jgi:hypothetical protein
VATCIKEIHAMLTIEGTIDLEKSDALLGLRDFQRRQLPFAEALALTRTAQAAQKDIRDGLGERFTLRSAFIERNVRIEPASKRTLQSAVLWRGPAGSRFGEALARQETGGTKRPRGRTLALPRDVKRGKSGAIPKAQRPRQILQRKNVFLTAAQGGAVILRRVTKSGPLRLLFFLSDQPARIQARFEFRATAAATARRVFRKEFGRAFAKALATRRK